MVFRARRTLKVRSAETLPRSTNSVTYLQGKVGVWVWEGSGRCGREDVGGEGWGKRTRRYTHAHTQVKHPHTGQSGRTTGVVEAEGWGDGWGGVGGGAEREEGSRERQTVTHRGRERQERPAAGRARGQPYLGLPR